MPSPSFPRRARPMRAALLVAALWSATLASATACVEQETSPRPQPTFTRVILRLTPNGGGVPQQVEITRSTKTASGPLTIPATGGTITATYFNVDGSEDAVLEKYQQEYQTRIVIASGPGAANFARNSANSFDVSRSTPGQATALVQLWDLGLKREVLGANVTVVVPE